MTGIAGYEMARHLELDERSTAGCALAVVGETAYLAWAGADLRINLVPVGTDGQVTSKEVFRHRTGTSAGWGGKRDPTGLTPALAGGPGGLHLAWVGTDGRLNAWALDRTPGADTVLAERSRHGPALAPSGDGVALAWTGRDKHLNVRRSRLWGPFADPVRLAVKSPRGPALCDTGAGVAVVWTAPSRRLMTATLRDGRLGPTQALEGSTNDAPAACAIEDGVLLAWAGVDGVLYTSSLREGRERAVTALNARSPHGPALCRQGDLVLLAWTADGRPNLARFRPGP